MVQDKETINIDLKKKLNEKQLRYVFGLISLSFSTQQIKICCLFRWSGMGTMQK